MNIEWHTDFSEEVASLWQTAEESDSSGTPFSGFSWHEAFARSFPTLGTPLIATDADSKTVGSFLKLGDTATFGGGDEIGDYLDIIGPDENKSTFWKTIIPQFPSRGISRLKLRNIPETSPTLTYFRSISADVRQEDTTPIIRLPGSWDTYLAALSRKNKHELERKIRKFERENPGCFTKISDQPDRDMDLFLTLMEKDAKKRVFLTPDMKKFFRNIPTLLPDACRLTFLFSPNQQPLAAIMGFIRNGTYFLYNSGFDEEAAPGSGFYLKAQSIRGAIETKLTTYNFLQGNERYKYELGGIDFPVYSVSLQNGR